jgi:hypothetical protein
MLDIMDCWSVSSISSLGIGIRSSAILLIVEC